MVRSVRVLQPSDRPAWEAFARTAGSFMQSWEWSEFKVIEGYSVLRLGVWKNEQLAGGAIVYGHRSPLEGQLCAVPGGPLLDWTHPQDWEDLVTAIRRAPESRRAVLLRIEPMLDELPSVLAHTVRAPSDLVPEQTLEIELGPEPAMRARMKPKGRYNTRLAERHGVEVVFSRDPADVHELYFVLEQTARYQNFLLEPRSFFVNLAQTLLPEMGQMVFARVRGMTLAAGFLVRYGTGVTYLYGGHLPIFSNRMAAYALHWETMKQAARAGFKRYDLYGFVGADQTAHPYYGFSRFKEKLGGVSRRRVGSRDLIFYDRLADVALNVLGGIK